MKYYSEDTVKEIIKDTVNATLHICKPKEVYPCIEIKEPHGRLVQAEDVKNILRSGVSVDCDSDKDYVCSLIDDLPTVIEASEETE